MRPHLTVRIDPLGHPYAEIPQQYVWELAEYFNFHRPNVSYHFDRESFKVTFHSQSAQHAQQLLDDWAAADCGGCEAVKC